MKIKLLYFFFPVLSLWSYVALAQVKVFQSNNVGVGTATNYPAAKLEVHSENKGFLKPRMSTSQREAIQNKVPGLEVYDTDLKKTYWWDGTQWLSAGPGSGGTIVTEGSGIDVTGSGTTGDPYVVTAINGGPSNQTLESVVTLLHSNEVASSEFSNSTTESGNLTTFQLGPNSFNYIIVEAIVKSRVDADILKRVNFTWRFKEAGVTKDSYVEKILAHTAAGLDGGGTYTNKLSVVLNGGQTVSTLLAITLQMDFAASNTGGVVESFRVYGVGDQVIEGVVGPPGPVGPEGPQGPPGAGCNVEQGSGIVVTGSGASNDPYIITNDFQESQDISTNSSIPGNLSISDGSTITINVKDDDHSVTNEIQSLSLNGQVLSISASNSVTLPSGNTDPTNLSFSSGISPVTLQSSTGDDVTITAGNNISLNATSTNLTINAEFEEIDGSVTNEIQTLSNNPNIPGNILLNKGGGTVNINVNDADYDVNNEIQDLSLVGNVIHLSKSPYTITLPGPGSGTENYLVKWTPDNETLGNSNVFDDGTTVVIGSENPDNSARFHISGVLNGSGFQGGGTTFLQNTQGEKVRTSPITQMESNKEIDMMMVGERKSVNLTKQFNGQLNDVTKGNENYNLNESSIERLDNLERQIKESKEMIQTLLIRIANLESQLNKN
jgi:hypothetical protein